jgi:hypothetical protein
MKTRPIIVMAAAALLLGAIPLLAHHSFSAEYDQSKVLSLQGKMVQFDWVNPHSWIYVEVTGANGEKTVWKGETPPINVLYRNGWTKPLVEDMVKKGEMVTLRGPAAKDGSHHVFAQGVTRQDGKTVLGLGDAPPEESK